MFNLSTQDVVLSIEKSPLEIKKGIIYQKYPNFFGNTFNFDLGGKGNFEKLENQTHLNRVKLSKHSEVMKKLTVFLKKNMKKLLKKEIKKKLKEKKL